MLSVALICCGSALASAPPSAFVRIEGAGATLMPQTLVHTTPATQIKGNTCPGTSAAGALELATGGNWSGSYSKSFSDYLVGTILGETPTGSNYWTLWINGRSSSTGACSTPLHPGDHELWFDCIADPVTFNCTNNPLQLTVPATVRLGRELRASVVQIDGAGHSSPIGGAAVSGPGAAGVSSNTGTAQIVPHQAGVITLHAAKSGATPSDPVVVCVYRRTPAECGSLTSGPAVHIASIREHQVLRAGPRLLHGTAGPDPSGITDVSLGLLRRAPNHRCSYYNADRGAWHSISCSAKAPRFSIGAGESWSYLLPKALAAGRYHLVVIATDGNGRRTKPVTGRSALDFVVKP